MNEISEIKIIFDFQMFFKIVCRNLVYFYSPSDTEPVFFIAPNSDIESKISDNDIKNKVVYFFEFYFSRDFDVEVKEIYHSKIKGCVDVYDCRKVEVCLYGHPSIRNITLVFLDQKSVARALSSVRTNSLHY